jgi:hypothetical protein
VVSGRTAELSVQEMVKGEEVTVVVKRAGYLVYAGNDTCDNSCFDQKMESTVWAPISGL